MRSISWLLSLLFSLQLSSCAPASEAGSVPQVEDPPAVPAATAVSFERDVKPILDRRCVVCHSCYNAPCQLKLSSPEGADRGATKKAVYRGDRLDAMRPTRLFVDAKTTAEWRQRDFFSVLERPGDDASKAPLMQRMLELGRATRFAQDAKLPDDVDLDISRTLTCATSSEFDEYAKAHPHGGMPYGLAPLSEHEYQTLIAWLEQGAKLPPDAPPALPPGLETTVAKWETFLNLDDPKHATMARYLYEHLFLAHLYFPDEAPQTFFRLVRSRTPSGQPIDEIATVRPYDDPGTASFYYRLWPMRSTIVYKTHMLYALSDAKMERYRQLFLVPEWPDQADLETPSYDAKRSANPFVTFESIPARARYQFLLDDAYFFIMTFIRGPVCRGQIALNVIEDQFWVAFLDPSSDLSVTDPTYLDDAKKMLILPAENKSRYTLGGLWIKYLATWRRYVDYRERRYRAHDPDKKGPALTDLWNGDGTNDNALLTVFRHFDSATVEKGYIGGIPKTAWVVDYPILERIYYDLVAGFNVFGNVVHQLSTRLYMDYLRMESEDLFLSFLPADVREPTRDSWYLGAAAETKSFLENRLGNLDVGTQVVYTTDDPKAELLEKIRASMTEQVRDPDDPINRCSAPPCKRAGASRTEQRVETQLQKLASVARPFVRRTPDVSFLRVRIDKTGKNDLVYTLVHNKDHYNVAFLFAEKIRRNPKADTMTIVPGYLGNYPNFFFDVDLDDIATFAASLAAAGDDEAFEAVVEAYGVRRSSPRFWALSDWMNDHFAGTEPVEAGLFDLERYGNY